MEIWMLLTLIVSMLGTTSHFQIDDHCQLHASIFEGKQITCTDVGLNYFLEFDIALNRTHWLSCENCTLNMLSETSFNIPARNNISFLELTHCKIRILRKFSFSKFPLLKYLNLRNNTIDTIDKLSFNGIKKLTHLDLSDNSIKYVSDHLFVDLENLDILNLNKNRVFQIHPEAFSGLIHLKYLYLNHNSLQKLHKNILKPLVNLKILYLESNQISEIHANAFLSLRNLNFLYINNNSISYLEQYNFKGLTSLIDLQLRSNKLREIETSSFNGLTNIKSLHLGDNQISYVKPYGFIGLETLEILELVKNELVNVSYFDYFSPMVNLKYLWLRKNKINNFTVTYRREVQNSLTVLDFGDNNLTAFNYQSLYNYMPNIREIFVSNNSWGCDFFIYMYNFFEVKNVSVCSSDSCDANVTQTYVDDICHLLQSTEVIENSDFSLDCATIYINASSITFIVMLPRLLHRLLWAF